MAKDSFAMIQKIYDVLSDAARNGKTISYSEAIERVGWTYKNAFHRGSFAYCLQAISLIELNVGNPLLTAVVVSKENGIPNEAFFDFARKEQRLRKNDTDETYWQRVIQEVFDSWKVEVNPAA